MISNKNFADWHADVFGYGYGTGEVHWIPALHAVMRLTINGPYQHSYEAGEIEDVIGQLPAWLLINDLCRVNVFEYGTSPRYGWLTERGKLLREYILSMSPDELLFVLDGQNDGDRCMPDYCNCVGAPGTCNPLYKVNA